MFANHGGECLTDPRSIDGVHILNRSRQQSCDDYPIHNGSGISLK